MVVFGNDANERIEKFELDSSDELMYRWAGSVYGGASHIIRDAQPAMWQEKGLQKTMCGAGTPRNGWRGAGNPDDDCLMCKYIAKGRGMDPGKIKRARS